MKIWITGICGFLGSRLAEVLMARGHVVGGNDAWLCNAVEQVPTGVYFKGFRCQDWWKFTHYWDEKEAGSFGKPDVLVHCAATAHEGLSVFSPSFITHNIYAASIDTFTAAIGSGVKKIINMSSMARYGNIEAPFKESDTPNPVDPYGVAKLAAERTLTILAKAHGIKHTNLIPHNLVGRGQRYKDPFRNVLSIMINRVKQGKPVIVYGDGEQRRCFSPVEDALDCLVKVIEEDFDGETINIGPDGDGNTINELAQMVFDACGVNTGITYMPDRPCEVKVALCSSDKARALLGYKEKSSLKECIAQMVDYIQPTEFSYNLPIEIKTERTPRTWTERLM